MLSCVRGCVIIFVIAIIVKYHSIKKNDKKGSSKMEEKRVVSIEDRIPKLKQERRKKANRKLIIYIVIFFILILVGIYLQSPLSNISKIEVEGEQFLTEDEIIETSKLDLDTNFWGGTQSNKVEEALRDHSQIKEAEVSKKLPGTIKIEVTELTHIGYMTVEQVMYPVLEDGTILEQVNKEVIDGSVPMIFQFKDANNLQSLANELSKLPRYIRTLISEIHSEPSDTNPYIIRLYMNDGYEVETTARDFASNLKTYPSIVSQLEGDKKGSLR